MTASGHRYSFCIGLEIYLDHKFEIECNLTSDDVTYISLVSAFMIPAINDEFEKLGALSIGVMDN